jgi:hypothetical protein
VTSSTRAPEDRPPYAKYAFLNAYNLGAVGASLAMAAATQQWWVAAVGLGAEALWMLFAPDSRLLKTFWFDKYHQKVLDQKRWEAMNAKFAALPEAEAQRCRSLQMARDQILNLAKDNPSFTKDLLQSELGKLDLLVMSFLDLAGTCTRYSQYMRTIDVQGIERDMERFKYQIDNLEEDDKRKVAQKNYAVLAERRDMYAEIAGDLQTARGQLDLIENTFRLLADKIVTMRSPAELSGELDELIDGVESIRKSTRETDKFMHGIERQLT